MLKKKGSSVAFLHMYEWKVIIVTWLISAPNFFKTQIENKLKVYLLKNLS